MARRIWNAAYIQNDLSNYAHVSPKEHPRYLRLLKEIMRDGVTGKLQAARTSRAAFDALQKYPLHTGNFIAMQHLIDISYPPGRKSSRLVPLKSTVSSSLYTFLHYLRVSTESQELHNQRTEILPFIDRRGWKLVHSFEDVMSGRKSEKDRPGFAAMLKAAQQRKFDILVFWALDRLTREGTRATLNYLQRLESKGVGYVSYQEQWLDSTGLFKDVIVAMFATLAKQERVRISERTIAGRLCSPVLVQYMPSIAVDVGHLRLEWLELNF
jgi:predicted site-specific integrase-resolvase